MALRDILAIITCETENSSALAYAEQLADASNGNLTVLVINWLPAPPLAVEGWVMDVDWSRLVTQSRDALTSQVQALKAAFSGKPHREIKSLLLQQGNEQAAVAPECRLSDVIIVGRPESQTAHFTMPLIEAVLFGSARPLISVPPGWKSGGMPQTVAICWNGTREATKAMGDAMPFIEAAKRAVVLTIGDDPAPAQAVGRHLAHHGVSAQSLTVDPAGRNEAEAIRDEARAAGADLVVMGGYGHSRLREYVFGGATRDMLTAASLPTLMAH